MLYLDLNDVHTLQTHLFDFLHHVVQGLRKKGVRCIQFPSFPLAYLHGVIGTQVWATYHLTFSLASVCIVRALPSTIQPSEEHERQVLLASSKFDTSDA